MEDFSQNQNQDNQQFTGQPQRKDTGQNLGIAALITAIVTFVFAVIPCVGLMAVIPGIIAIVLAAVGLSRAVGDKTPRGILVAALVIGVVATLISLSQIVVTDQILRKADKFPRSIEKIVNDVQEDVLRDLEKANIDIRIENGDEKVEISTRVNSSDRVKTLEDLEMGNTSADDTLARQP